MISITPVELAPVCTEQIRVSGIVQGVGLRPWIFLLASERGLRGTVCNDGAGVCITVGGAQERVDDFVCALQHAPPPLSRIDRIERAPVSVELQPGFQIIDSQHGPARTAITADAATCSACLKDIFDSSNRRFRYPFTNCTHCGPRLSIVRAVPYDRCNTSMAVFPMCGACLQEYQDPHDRRFHAQPNACAACGPKVWLELGSDVSLQPRYAGFDAIIQARNLILAGQIVAVKGLGGFHLACDATNESAVARLRMRKNRHDKPFALMARDMAGVTRYCRTSRVEQELLQSPVAPIVLLNISPGAALAPSVAKGQRSYGFMLPYTPLHHLLLQDVDIPIVFTSGNRSDEPQCIENTQAREWLGGIADFLLLNDRDIVNRVDDSLVQASNDKPRWLRRARGLAPASLPLPAGFEAAPPVLAMGGELKSTFCLVRDGQAILSPHLGDLENVRAWAAYRQTLELYLHALDHAPKVLAVDLHPEYLSSKLGRQWASTKRLALVEVQHHHAHIAACLVDNAVPLGAAPVLGVAWDGLGFGSDGTLWGGEFLLVDYRQSRRLAAFKPVPMPGGTQAIREPWRMAYAYLSQQFGAHAGQHDYAGVEFFRTVAPHTLTVLDAMMRAGFNSPLTSSCGRLFDAVASLAGVCSVVSYEGQAAMALQACIDPGVLHRGERYDFTLEPVGRTGMAWIDTKPLWPALLEDIANRVDSGCVAARFHNGLVKAIVTMAAQLAQHHGNPWENRIALSGGVFQNETLLDAVIEGLEASGHTVYSHSGVPANDGGLSLGQAVVAAARIL